MKTMRIVMLLIILFVIAIWPVHILILKHYQTVEILEAYRINPEDEFIPSN